MNKIKLFLEANKKKVLLVSIFALFTLFSVIVLGVLIFSSDKQDSVSYTEKAGEVEQNVENVDDEKKIQSTYKNFEDERFGIKTEIPKNWEYTLEESENGYFSLWLTQEDKKIASISPYIGGHGFCADGVDRSDYDIESKQYNIGGEQRRFDQCINPEGEVESGIIIFNYDEDKKAGGFEMLVTSSDEKVYEGIDYMLENMALKPNSLDELIFSKLYSQSGQIYEDYNDYEDSEDDEDNVRYFIEFKDFMRIEAYDEPNSTSLSYIPRNKVSFVYFDVNIYDEEGREMDSIPDEYCLMPELAITYEDGSFANAFSQNCFQPGKNAVYFNPGDNNSHTKAKFTFSAYDEYSYAQIKGGTYKVKKPVRKFRTQYPSGVAAGVLSDSSYLPIKGAKIKLYEYDWQSKTQGPLVGVKTTNKWGYFRFDGLEVSSSFDSKAYHFEIEGVNRNKYDTVHGSGGWQATDNTFSYLIFNLSPKDKNVNWSYAGLRFVMKSED